MRYEKVATDDCCIQKSTLKINKNSFFNLIINLKNTTRSISAKSKANVSRDANKTNKKFDRNKEIVLKEIIVDWNREFKNRNECGS